MRKFLLATGIGTKIETVNGTSEVTAIESIKRQTDLGVLKMTKIVLQDKNGNDLSMTFHDQGAKEKAQALLGELAEVPEALTAKCEEISTKAKCFWKKLVETGKEAWHKDAETV